jgi:subtilase family serine protease
MHISPRIRSKRGSQFATCVFVFAAFLLILRLSPREAYAQLPNRVPQIIDQTQTTPLHGSVMPPARAQNDIDRVSADTRLTGITIYFRLTQEQQTELDALVQAQQTPGSPWYHKQLTPAEYASRFGLSDGDLEKMQTWLELQGFTIDRISDSRTSIGFSGTVRQVESAFQTEIHHYKIDGETHFANATQLSIPVALADVIESVGNLNDFSPKPQVQFHKPAPDSTSSQPGNQSLTPKNAVN